MQSQKTQFEISIYGANPDSFDKDKNIFMGIYGSFPMDFTLTGSTREVFDQMAIQLKVSDKSYRFLVASVGNDVVGMMIMAKSTSQTSEWIIFDLISMEKGAGTALATAGVRMALTDAPGKPVRLLSIDPASTAFWKKRGFELDKPDNTDLTRNVPMTYKPQT